MPSYSLLKTYVNSPDYFENLNTNVCEEIAFDNWVEVVTTLVFIGREWLLLPAFLEQDLN